MVQEKINESRRFNKSFKMPRRTYEKDAQYIVVADDLDEIVKDKRLRWSAIHLKQINAKEDTKSD